MVLYFPFGVENVLYTKAGPQSIVYFTKAIVINLSLDTPYVL